MPTAAPFRTLGSAVASAPVLAALAVACGMHTQSTAAADAAGAPSVPFTESFRPQYHFSPARNWLNDPNGLLHANGEYHLFFQYNPLGDKWGHMSWGHAVSADLLHWRELPVAIPETEQGMIFSGSVVEDAHDSSGLGDGTHPPLVAIYTSAGRGERAPQRQHLAYSRDAGRTWTQYAGNPVLDIGSIAFRDPKVFYHEPSHAWIMVVSKADEHRVAFYTSSDLKSWTHLSDFGPAGAVDGPWECPDFFELPVDGDAANKRWVLKMDVFRSSLAQGSGAQYFVGRFDGKRFIPDPDPAQPGTAAPVQWVDHGADFYAALSWQNLPREPQRHVWVAWMNSHFYAQEIPTSPWRGAMTLPREVSLHDGHGYPRLRQVPMRELEALRGTPVHIGARPLNPGVTPLKLAPNAGKSMEILVVIEPGSAQEVGLNVRVGARERTVIGYDRTSSMLVFDRSRSGRIPSPVFAQRRNMPVRLRDGRVALRIFIDWSSIEVFANVGEGVLTGQVFASPRSTGIELYARGIGARLVSMHAWPLRRAVGTAP